MFGYHAPQTLQHLPHGLVELTLAGIARQHLGQNRLQFLVNVSQDALVLSRCCK